MGYAILKPLNHIFQLNGVFHRLPCMRITCAYDIYRSSNLSWIEISCLDVREMVLKYWIIFVWDIFLFVVTHFVSFIIV